MNEHYPLVCICVPNYNNERTISETLDSLLNQTYKNIIIKIFDNASTDNSMKILKEYEAKHSSIQVFRNETNIGGEQNFNKCFDNAEGEYIAVFHSDDIYNFEIIEKEFFFLEKNTNCSAVSTNSFFIDKDSKVTGRANIPNEIEGTKDFFFSFIDLFKILLKYGNFIMCPSVMARTKIIKNNIKFWDYESFKTSSDLDVWLRLSKNGDFGIINEPLISYRLSDASYSYIHNRLATTMFDMFLVFEKYINDIEVYKHLSKADCDNYYFLYNKSCLSVNMNKYLLNKYDYIEPKTFKFILSKKYFILTVVNLIFNVIKFIKLPKKIKIFILNIKVNGKWFR